MKKKSLIKNEEGICPVCGNGNLNYGILEPTDSGVMYPWDCPNCSSHGEEHYNIAFIMHLDVTDKDANSYGYDEIKDTYYKEAKLNKKRRSKNHDSN